jgi:medium-chain acyl-[acyl-carrier-protein] hydrolase
MSLNSFTDRWILTPRSAVPPACRLFCIPHAGGGAAQFINWSRNLPPQIQVYGVQPPGRENRFQESPLRRLDALVTATAAALSHWLDLPYALFGYSLGGLIAFELAHRLALLKAPPPKVLFVAACRPPHAIHPMERISQLDDYLLTKTLHQRYGNMPPELGDYPELRQLYLPTLRADLEMMETYVYREYKPLNCSILALSGVEDVTVSHHQLVEWSRYTRAPCHPRIFPGGHFFLKSYFHLISPLLTQELSRYW